jgi:hypothetical protein
MCSLPHVVGRYMHSLLDKLDQGFSRPRTKMVPGVGDKIKASQGSKGATPCVGASLPGGRLDRG